MLLAYLQMDPSDLSWSTESIGYGSQDGESGVQISYDQIPPSGTVYYIASSCHSMIGSLTGSASTDDCVSCVLGRADLDFDP